MKNWDWHFVFWYRHWRKIRLTRWQSIKYAMPWRIW